MRKRRLIAHRLIVIRAATILRTVQGRRFLELESLLSEFLVGRLENNPELCKSVAKQLLNVLKHCDQITYEEPGTAEAYVLLHFLDRYHRFQLIFDSLHKNRLMPLRGDGIRILDVGTGPGPSMFAVSDFYSITATREPTNTRINKGLAFSIDYVERSYQFRSWLHHFTEFVNYNCPTQALWRVPFHHGTFFDFQNLEFNPIRSVRKHPFDLIVFSNFLTTKEQAAAFSKEIENCARHLRNNGILLVVGAKSSAQKYKEVYEEIDKIIVSGIYSNRKQVARCDRVEIADRVMGYSWHDCYGERLKALTKCVVDILQVQAGDSLPTEASDLLRKSIHPEYSRAIEWELLVFRKEARPRQKALKFSRSTDTRDVDLRLYSQ
jgi:SAM-dependent methyltransferase